MVARILHINESLKLPGVGYVITSGEGQPNLDLGAAGFIGRANKGPLGTSVRCYNKAHIERVYGPVGVGGNTMDGAVEALNGGAEAVEIVRLGASGAPAAKATHSFNDGAALAVVKVDAKDPGTSGNDISVMFRANAADVAKQDAVVTVLGALRELFTYTIGADAAAALVAQVAAQGSELIAVTKLATGDGTIATIGATALTGGANPTVANGDYATAMALLGTRPWFAVASDSVTPAVHAILKAAIDDLILHGHMRMVVVAEPTTVTWSTRVTNCKALADPGVVYVGSGFDRTVVGSTTAIAVDGYLAAGREAGRHATLRLARQLTHNQIQDSITVREQGVSGQALTEDQLIEGTNAGMYLYTTADSGKVMTVDGVNTFWRASPDPVPTPPVWADSADRGWGKSRLIRTRFGMLNDIDVALEPMIEDTNNTPQGRASVAREVKNVIEGIYLGAAVSSYTLVESTGEPALDDHATWELAVTTPDGLTKLKFAARFSR